MPTCKVKGVIAEGNALGRKLGYPTANIYGLDGVEAADGVYAVTVEVDGQTLRGMANLGYRPTVEEGGKQRVLEFHLFDFAGDLYGREVSVCFEKYIRPEQVFAGTEQLRIQLAEDEKAVREYYDIQK